MGFFGEYSRTWEPLSTVVPSGDQAHSLTYLAWLSKCRPPKVRWHSKLEKPQSFNSENGSEEKRGKLWRFVACGQRMRGEPAIVSGQQHGIEGERDHVQRNESCSWNGIHGGVESMNLQR
jgi:hypothetical protein